MYPECVELGPSPQDLFLDPYEVAYSPDYAWMRDNFTSDPNETGWFPCEFVV